MQETGKSAKEVQALLVEQATEREKILRKPVAADTLVESLTGEETWDEIQQMNGFRHFVLCDQSTEAYLGVIREAKDSRQIAWTERPLQAQAFATVEAAEAMIRRINSNPEGYRQVSLLIGALMETETQYVAVFRRDATVEPS
jgi:hypothetical protein